MKTEFYAAAMLIAHFLTGTSAGAVYDRVFEAVPAKFISRLETNRIEIEAKLSGQKATNLEGVTDTLLQWDPGRDVTVGFLGGTDAVLSLIEQVANQWTNGVNLKFSFRTPDGAFRRWSTDDKQFKADIRIRFDDPSGGYFSLVGTDSANSKICFENEASMNLQGFDTNRPPGWEGTVLHEFGHAIGFQHEHQHPDEGCDFRFEDDPGYIPTTNLSGQFTDDKNGRRPGLYRFLGGPPNKWPKDKVKFNLAPLVKESRRYRTSKFDPLSIMKYHLPDYMFASGRNSACYTDQENEILSKSDRETAAAAYPFDPAAIKSILEIKKRLMDALKP